MDQEGEVISCNSEQKPDFQFLFEEDCLWLFLGHPSLESDAGGLLRALELLKGTRLLGSNEGQILEDLDSNAQV